MLARLPDHGVVSHLRAELEGHHQLLQSQLGKLPHCPEHLDIKHPGAELMKPSPLLYHTNAVPHLCVQVWAAVMAMVDWSVVRAMAGLALVLGLAIWSSV